MRDFRFMKLLSAFVVGCGVLLGATQTQEAHTPAEAHHAAICEPCIRAHMDFLASDALRGRGSSTANEFTAATYIATELERAGIEPAGDDGSFLQRVPVPPSKRRPDANKAARPAADAAAQPAYTWNVIGKLAGEDPVLGKEVVLLTAHLDHLGVRRVKDTDVIFHGADDDASGVAAVLELARALAEGERPKRTVIFALFGSEEPGLIGSRYFLDHSPVPLADIIANLEFEMIGRADPAIAPHTLWLTGWDRTNLGPALAEHGAHLVGDPHPKEDFFRRSDNYALARRGIVAQTISSFGLHKDYHQPSDDLAHIDFGHLEESIASLIKPVRWLVTSNFKPEWNPGKKP